MVIRSLDSTAVTKMGIRNGRILSKLRARRVSRLEEMGKAPFWGLNNNGFYKSHLHNGNEK